MPVVKLYNIVTNDEYELPIKQDLKGAKEASEYLGISVSVFRTKLCTDKWGKLKYKAYVSGIVETDKKEYMRKYGRSEKRKEINRRYYWKHKEKRLEYHKKYATEHSEELNMKAKMRRMEKVLNG